MTNTDIDSILRELADQDEIAQVITSHSRGIDRSDASIITNAYHPDGSVDYGFYNGSAAGLAEILGQSTPEDTMSLHRPSNVWIEVDGDRAKSETYIMAFMQGETDGKPVQIFYGGRYLDRHERRNGIWRMAHRLYVLDWHMEWPGTGTADPAYDISAYNTGQPGRADKAYDFLSGAHAAPAKETSMTDDLATRAQTALDRQEIHKLIVAQARALDRGDKALLDSLWHPGATVNVGVFEGSATEFSEMIMGFTEDRPAMSHNVANEWIEIRGDEAVSETYLMAYSKLPDGDGFKDEIVGGRYLDRFEKRDGEWKYTHRTFVMDWITSHPVAGGPENDMLSRLDTRGGKVPNDPVYALWAG